jgi:HNH endonuclease
VELSLSDPFDPNTWAPSTHEFRIYGDNNAQTWAIVDEEDYHYFAQWRWNWKRSPRGKLYLRRAVGENANGLRLRTFTLYLHVEIQKRTGRLPPTKSHTLVDHRNGNSTDNRRCNLRWVTPSMNNKNLFGQYAGDLIEDAT